MSLSHLRKRFRVNNSFMRGNITNYSSKMLLIFKNGVCFLLKSKQI